MIDILKKLCAPIAVSGYENDVCDIIKTEIAPYCDKIYTDNLGNLYAEKKGKTAPKSKIMLAAHMDEVGFIITNKTEDGFLKFSSVGGVDPRLYVGKQVVIKAKEGEVRGVIGMVPMHLLSGDGKTAVMDEDSLYIDVGGCDNLVSLGDTGVMVGDFEEFGEDKILARALDDRCGCAVLIDLLKRDLPCDITAVFTVQEEIGCRGALVAAQNVNPDIAIVVDSTTACDIQDIAPDKTVCEVGGGGVVSFMDRGCAYDRELFSLILKTSEEQNIPSQLKRAVAGGNDASNIHKSSGGVKTAAISLPCRYIHSSGCVIDRKDLYKTADLIFAVLDRLTKL